MNTICAKQTIGEQILIAGIILLILFTPLIICIIADIVKPCKKPKRSAIAGVITLCFILLTINFDGIFVHREYQTTGIIAFIGLIITITVSSIVFNKQKKKSRAEKLKEDKEKKERKELEDIERRIRAEEEIREKIRQERKK